MIQALMDGRPHIAMIDTSLGDHKFRASFPWFLAISTPLTSPTTDGLPTGQEASALNDWEDSIESKIASACLFVYVGRVTWNGSRELLYYVDKPRLQMTTQQGLSAFIPSVTNSGAGSAYTSAWVADNSFCPARRSLQ